MDSSLGIPGSWTLLDSSACCIYVRIPDAIGKNYPESGLLYMGRIICEIREIYVQKFTYVLLSESSTFASCATHDNP